MWAGISRKGRTGICIFDGTMNAVLYCQILQKTLLPFIKDVFPAGECTHRFMQDNDPKHVSKLAQKFLKDNDVNWWRTPPESPDANPIENLWHELKEFVRSTKPQSKDDLVWTIKAFWRTVSIAKCNRYINHLKKVVPRMIEVEGRATGY